MSVSTEMSSAANPAETTNLNASQSSAQAPIIAPQPLAPPQIPAQLQAASDAIVTPTNAAAGGVSSTGTGSAGNESATENGTIAGGQNPAEVSNASSALQPISIPVMNSLVSTNKVRNSFVI